MFYCQGVAGGLVKAKTPPCEDAPWAEGRTRTPWALCRAPWAENKKRQNKDAV